MRCLASFRYASLFSSSSDDESKQSIWLKAVVPTWFLACDANCPDARPCTALSTSMFDQAGVSNSFSVLFAPASALSYAAAGHDHALLNTILLRLSSTRLHSYSTLCALISYQSRIDSCRDCRQPRRLTCPPRLRANPALRIFHAALLAGSCQRILVAGRAHKHVQAEGYQAHKIRATLATIA